MRTFTEFFGFRQDPFKRTPDVEFYYPTKMHLDALDTLNYMLHSDEPFAVITGEPGTGKTITIKKFMNELPDNIVSAYILFPNLTPEELFMAILEDFNIHVDKNLTKNALFARLRDFLIEIGASGKKAVIIIDEAQNLPNETLEELRILSNLETEKEKLLKIILAGQPELDDKLDEESLRQLKQRVTLYVKLDNIHENDIKEYINSHLEKAGKSPVKIHNNVINKIAKITKGNPRLINTLMERTIIAAFLDNSHTITEHHLTSAIASVNTVISTIRRKRSVRNMQIAAAAAVVLLVIAVLFLGLDKYTRSSDKRTVIASAPAPAERAPAAPVRQEQPAGVNETPQVNNDIRREAETASAEIAPQPEENTGISDTASSVNTAENTYETVNAADIAVPVIEEPAAAPAKDVYILTNSLNVRATPSTDAERVGNARLGERYVYLDENDEWVHIRLSPAVSGWVYKRYVNIFDSY
ncbi:MAG: AAA family ATPase [Mucispirillum sp.]|nr:AAA family ATPase [Mucispirillum sp.]